jgi:hypothetical protein
MTWGMVFRCGKPRDHRRIAQRVSSGLNRRIELNPTLVHHGLAKSARWHVVSANKQVPIADLYRMTSREAARVAEELATVIRLPVMLLSNRGTPARLDDHVIVRSAGGHLSHGPRSNPSRRPVAGEVWKHTITGVKCEVLRVSGNRIEYLESGTGRRLYETVGEFVATHKAPSAAPRRNPKGRNAATAGLPRTWVWTRQAFGQDRSLYAARDTRWDPTVPDLVSTSRADVIRQAKEIVKYGPRPGQNGRKRVLNGRPKGHSRRTRRHRVGTRTTRTGGRGARMGPRKANARRNPRSPVEAAKAVHRMWQDRNVTQHVRRVRHPMRVPKAVASLGKLAGVIYDSDKFDGKKKRYEHRFKRPLPELTAGPDGRLHIVGGGYKTTSDGLVN